MALAKALRKLVDSPSLRRQMGEAGRIRIERQFTLKQKMERTETSYRKLLQKGGFR
jgi:glycosyltransferase involved in cell wall biosynthesis